MPTLSITVVYEIISLFTMYCYASRNVPVITFIRSKISFALQLSISDTSSL